MTTGHVLEAVVDTVAELLNLRIGLRPDPTLRGRLRRAIREEASRHGQDPTAYVESLVADGGVLQSLMNQVTVQETAFFRHPEHFDVLAQDVLPELVPPVRIWSAACSNGQEAYSLAMLLAEADVDGTVVATDLSTAALHRTSAARYTRRELSGVSAERLARHFVGDGDAWQVAPAVRSRVKTLHHNLLDPLPREVLGCQVVFCRNVLIYLSPDQVRLFLDRIADDLAPSTTLFVGGAETIWQASQRFEAIRRRNAFIYRQRRSEPPRRDVAVVRAGQPVDARRQPERAERPRPVRTPRPRAPSSAGSSSTSSAAEIAVLEKAAQEAVAAGDYDAATVAFRKCAYLRPHDPLAQLHLGLALEAAGDADAARRAFAASRRALAQAGADLSLEGLEGYTVAELIRLLDSKR
jgi:chemotaxis methyl-accepting protein methylase